MCTLCVQHQWEGGQLCEADGSSSLWDQGRGPGTGHIKIRSADQTVLFIDYIVAASKKIVAEMCECVFDQRRGPGTGHIKIRSADQTVLFIDFVLLRKEKYRSWEVWMCKHLVANATLFYIYFIYRYRCNMDYGGWWGEDWYIQYFG